MKWKPFINFAIDGTPFKHDAQALNDDPTLLSRIEKMPNGRPVSVHVAFGTYWDALMDHLVGDGGGGAEAAGNIFNEDWVQWISKQGFKIVLKGDEYELSQLN